MNNTFVAEDPAEDSLQPDVDLPAAVPVVALLGPHGPPPSRLAGLCPLHPLSRPGALRPRTEGPPRLSGQSRL